jgi:hypothetical protein
MTMSGVRLTQSKFKSLVQSFFLALTLIAASASIANAASITIQTDGTWLTKNTAPGAGWNTNALFDTTADSGWILATVSAVLDCGTQDCIWYDEYNSATQVSYFRKTFNISDPVASASLFGGIDDDADIWVNGTQVVNDHNGQATGYGPIDIASYLVQGENLIAVWGWDNIPVYGQQHTLHAQIDIETRTTRDAPEPSAMMLLLGSGLLALTAKVRRQRRS